MMFRSLIPHRPERAVRPIAGVPSGFGNLFDELWGDFGPAPGAESSFAPRVDVEETDDEVVVTMELPGVEEKDFEVSIEEGVLTIKGQKQTERDESKEGYRYVERSSGSFRRSFRIPWEVDSDALKAAYQHGVLSVTVPKPIETRPESKRIPVETS